MRTQERVSRAIRYVKAAQDARVEQWLSAQHLGNRQLFYRDPRGFAAFHKPRGVTGIIPGCDDKKATCILDALRHDAAQDAVFLNAFCCGLRVFYRVTTPAVQQPVVAPGGAVGEVALLDQDRFETTHCQVA